MNCVETRGISKYFRTPFGMLHAVEEVSLEIKEKMVLGVVGESGCGKSTLGRLAVGLHDATSGTLLFGGRDVAGMNRRELKQLHRERQMIFQDPSSSLDPRKNVFDLIAEPMKIMKICAGRKEREARIAELMDTVGLSRRLAYSYPHELDGGRRQRIGIARALSVDPKFIVCDEPVSALDVSIQAQILNLLQDLRDEKGLTYMFITHDLSVVRHISDAIMVMYLGCAVEYADSKDLFTRPLHPYTKGLLSAIPVPSIHVERKEYVMAGEVSSPIEPKPGCRFATRCPEAEEICTEAMPVSEEIAPGHFCACHRAREINGY
jgi:peptide/nickel transport system ATP-binding protein